MRRMTGPGGGLLLSLILAAGPVAAEKPDKGLPDKANKAAHGAPGKQDWPDHRPDKALDGKSEDVTIGLLPALPKRDRDMIRDYIRIEGVPGYDRYPGQSGKQKDLPPGLQKKVERGGSLPPGWRDKVIRGEVLPGDLRRYAYPLPASFYDRMGYDRAGVEMLVLGDRVVRLAEGRGTVLDVIDIADIMLR
ncbi:MAG: hypothetical protein HWE39_22230 [Oceanospirillaceae bacterium]|nr:hypothetical protein [Oceanospirillaceae bacterium]